MNIFVLHAKHLCFACKSSGCQGWQSRPLGARGVMCPCTDAHGGLFAQGSRYKVHNVLDTTHKDFDQHTAAVWENAEMFDPKTEHMFRYLQVRWLLKEGNRKPGVSLCILHILSKTPGASLRRLSVADKWYGAKSD